MDFHFNFRSNLMQAEIDVEVSASVEIATYGEDADGNRGKSGRVVSVKSFSLNFGKEDITAVISEANNELFEDFEKEAEKKAIEESEAYL